MTDVRVLNEPLPGLFVLEYPKYFDNRGDFLKLYHFNSLHSQGISFIPAETFLTRSKLNVLRGMHFQIGEHEHDKLVICIKGKVLDVVVDVRPDSKNFNKPFAIELTQANNISLLIGKGYAHGFLALHDDSWMYYLTSTVHSPSSDRGIHWSSIDFDWPISVPIISKRDSHHPNILTLL